MPLIRPTLGGNPLSVTAQRMVPNVRIRRIDGPRVSAQLRAGGAEFLSKLPDTGNFVRNPVISAGFWGIGLLVEDEFFPVSV